MCSTDGSKLFDVWEDGNRAPVATEVSKEEANKLVEAAPMARQACCSYCGLVGWDYPEKPIANQDQFGYIAHNDTN